MKFLVMGLLSLCLLFAGCDSFDFGQNDGGVIPPANESTENCGSSNENEENEENGQGASYYLYGIRIDNRKPYFYIIAK